MPVGGSDFGTLPPYGTSLSLANEWIDGAVQYRSGSSLTTNSGSTVTLGGTVNLAGNATFGAAPVNDLTEAISPSSYGLAAFNFPYLYAVNGSNTGSAVTTAGLLYLAKVPLAGGTVVTNLWFSIATAAATPTTGENFGGIYNSAGTLVATTADLSTAIGTNTGPIEAPLAAAYTIPSGGGNYYVGFFFNAGTQPVLTCFGGQVTVTTSVAHFGSATTFGNTAAKYPFAVSATTGNTTAMPTSITMSSNTATGAYAYWVGVN
jgi:hypothetical protein